MVPKFLIAVALNRDHAVITTQLWARSAQTLRMYMGHGTFVTLEELKPARSRRAGNRFQRVRLCEYGARIIGGASSRVLHMRVTCSLSVTMVLVLVLCSCAMCDSDSVACDCVTCDCRVAEKYSE